MIDFAASTQRARMISALVFTFMGATPIIHSDVQYLKVRIGSGLTPDKSMNG